MVDLSKSFKQISLLYLISVILSLGTNFVVIFLMRFFGSSMYPFFITFYIWTAAYMLLLSVFLRGIRLDYFKDIPDKILLAVFLSLTVCSRLVFLGINEFISLDSLWYLDFGHYMTNGYLPYTDFYFPYPPVFGYFIQIIHTLAPSVDSFRLFATFLDMLVVFLLWVIVRKRFDSQWAHFIGLAYAMLPMSIIESGWNGHFEPLVAFFVLLSVYFLLDRKSILSGIFLGLATATKIVPGLLLPVFILYFKTWKKRLGFAISACISAIATIIPFLVPVWFRPVEGTGPSTTENPPNFISVLLESIFNPSSHPVIVSVLLISGISFLFLTIIIQFLRGPDVDNTLPYNIISGVLGIVLIAMGLIAAWYPLSPVSRFVYWRYPADVGIVRGITACAAGFTIIYIAFTRWKRGELLAVSKETLMILVSTVVLLMISIAREVFYGWYLLWAIPLLFILNDRRLLLMVLLGLLLVYPSYTHDNFNSLGYEEERIWSEEFTSMQGWNTYINRSNSGIPTGVVSAETYVDESKGYFSVDTALVSDEKSLENVSIVFRKNYDFRVETNTEFVIRMSCSWDPAFGKFADVSLKFFGSDSTGDAINGSIIPKTSIFTNLTNLLWRYSLSSEVDCNTSCVIDKLVLTVFPNEIGEFYYSIDYLYTTHGGPLNPRYIIISITLVTISFAAYTLLSIELGRAVQKKQ